MASIGQVVRAFVQPDAEIEGESEQQDVNERARELTQQAAPERIGWPLGQRVRPDAGEPFGRNRGREPAHGVLYRALLVLLGIVNRHRRLEDARDEPTFVDHGPPVVEQNFEGTPHGDPPGDDEPLPKDLAERSG